ncbi:MAG: hypothetical protein FJY85_13665, partial [Deltaproteobacteria bacterium]|nr:hypothetical protein [Deltaproteobacteria bacterium]
MKTRRGRVVFPASRIEETEDMAVRAEDKLDLSNYSLLDVVVDRDRTLVAVLAVATVILALFVPDLQTDPSLESGIDRSSEAFQHNKQFVEVFGQEEFILVALKSDEGAGDPRTLHALDRISDGFGKLAPVEEVISLSNLRIFQKRGDLFGTYPVVQVTSGEYSLPDKDSLERMKRALPIMEYLISADFKTLGVLLRLQERYRFDVPAIKQLVSQMDKIVRENVSTGTEYKIVGAPLIRNAVVRYNIQTGVIFGILCMFIATAVSIYVFRSVNVTAISNVILAICVLWILGLMSALRIPLNSTTVLSFGFIPLTTIEIVIHMVVRYHVFHQTTRDKVGALKQAVRWLA